MARILIADDEPRILEALSRLLKLEKYEVEMVRDGALAVDLLSRGGIDLLLLDLDMPRMDGIATLKKLRELKISVPVVMVSGRGTIQSAVEAIQLGALDFVEKPVDDERLLLSLARILEFQRMREEVAILRADQSPSGIVTESSAMKEIVATVAQIARGDSTVLITGETGVGKEVIARMVHDKSTRAHQPFVSVNCAALPETLAESELFGYVRGAFTGAVRDRKGRFQLADGGTLFLDEVGELPMPLQAKLLRAIAEGKFEPLGSERTIHTDVRIIAATNRELRGQIEDGNFREDLYYRLAVFELEIPPLRERSDDILSLASEFLREFKKKLGRRELRVVNNALVSLLGYSWPGNVRELRNVIERIAVTASSGEIDTNAVKKALPRASPEIAGMADSRPGKLSHAMAMEEAARLRSALQETKGNVSAAARVLGLERSHLYKKLKRHGIK